MINTAPYLPPNPDPVVVVGHTALAVAGPSQPCNSQHSPAQRERFSDHPDHRDRNFQGFHLGKEKNLVIIINLCGNHQFIQY